MTSRHGSMDRVVVNANVITMVPEQPAATAVAIAGKLRRTEDAKTGTADKPAEIPADVKLLTEIRDLLKTGRTS